MKISRLVMITICALFGAAILNAQPQRAPVPEKRFATGLLPSPADKTIGRPLALSLGAGVTPSTLPPEILLNEYLPPVGDQGKQYSCLAWAVGYYSLSYAVARQQKLKPGEMLRPERQFSPAFLFNLRSGKNQKGMSLFEVREVLRQHGCTNLRRMPYNARSETAPTREARKAAHHFVGNGDTDLYEFERDPKHSFTFNVKAYLASQRLPVVVAMQIPPSFEAMTKAPYTSANFVYKPWPGERVAENHALTIVGYNQRLRAFRVVNSWGTTWGNLGFMWLDENYVEAWRGQAIAVRGAGPFPLGGDNMPLRLNIAAETLQRGVPAGVTSGLRE